MTAPAREWRAVAVLYAPDQPPDILASETCATETEAHAAAERLAQRHRTPRGVVMPLVLR